MDRSTINRAKELLESHGYTVEKSHLGEAINSATLKVPTFEEWLEQTYYPGFDPSGLSDEEYYELEDQYYKEIREMPDTTPQDYRESLKRSIKEAMSNSSN